MDSAGTINNQEFKLSIVIPCYNEQNRINLLLEALKKFAHNWKHNFELIIVDDGSTDGVWNTINENEFIQDLIKSNQAIIHAMPQNGGKGKALQKGVALATGSHILTMDADLSYHPDLIIDWLKRKGAFEPNEILVGSRLHKESTNTWEVEGAENKNKVLRKIAGYTFSAITKILTSIKVRDNQSGFKLYPAPVAKYLFNKLQITGWAHDVELLYRADLNRYKITEMPVHCINREGSKINVVSDSIKMFMQTVGLGISMRWKYYLAEPLKILTGNSSEIPPVHDPKVYKREAIYRLLFSVTTILMFIIMPLLSRNYGIAGDEWIQNQYGKEVFNFFVHGDSTAFSETGRVQNYDAIIYYSGGYELFLVTVAKMFPSIFEYDVRHFLIAITGCFLFLFTGLFAKRLGGWRVGFFALLFVWIAPRLFGESLNNSKDIPFALGMIFTLYHFVPFLKQLPRPSWRSVILIILGIAYTLNIRIGGLMLYAYLGLFTLAIYIAKIYAKEINGFFNPDFPKLVFKGIVIFVVSYFLGVITWPWALQSPISNPILSMEKMTNFPITVSVLFDGKMIYSALPPKDYTLTWIMKTSPEITLLWFMAFILLLIPISKKMKSLQPLFLLFVTIFPVAYAVYKESGLYDGWRHFLFIYPTICIGAALAMNYLLEKSNNKLLNSGIVLITLIGLALPTRKLITLHPNQYVYFNDFSGGLAGNYKKFETDYYMSSARECFMTLAQKENLYAAKDTVYVATNMVKELIEYAKLVSPFVKPIYSKFETRINQNYDYGVFMSRFVDYELLKADGWPAKNAIITIERDNVPLTFAIKNDHKGDSKGVQAFNDKNYAQAILEFTNYLTYDSTNEAVWAKLGESYMQLQQFDKAAEAFYKAYDYYPNDNNGMMLGVSLAQSNQPQKAIDVLTRGANRAIKRHDEYKETYQNNKKDMMAGSMMQMNAEIAGTYFYYLAIVYNQMGNPTEAQNASMKAQRYNPNMFQK